MPNPSSSSASPVGRRAASAATTAGETATIGSSTFIKGKIEGNDDLVIRGRVEGTVKLPNNRVLIASGSRVKANVTARSIEVEGLVQGKLNGEMEVTVRAGGQVEGDIVARRVSLESGAQFNGTVDMGSAGKEDAPSESKATQRAVGGT